MTHYSPHSTLYTVHSSTHTIQLLVHVYYVSKYIICIYEFIKQMTEEWFHIISEVKDAAVSYCMLGRKFKMSEKHVTSQNKAAIPNTLLTWVLIMQTCF